MSTRMIQSRTEAAQMLDAAVNCNALAVLCCQYKDEWVTFKSRFLERDPKQRFFVLDYQETHGATPPPLLPGQYLGLSFRHKSRKLLFGTVVEAKGKFLVAPGQTVAAVRYRWPDSLTEMQRRAYERTPLPAGVELGVQVWSGGVAARGGSLAVTPINGAAMDLSCGGSLMRIEGLATPPFVDNQTLGVELRLPDGRPPLLVNAHYRGTRFDRKGNLCVALQFVGLEADPDNRMTLMRLARCVQKFNRLNLAREARAAGNTRRDDDVFGEYESGEDGLPNEE